MASVTIRVRIENTTDTAEACVRAGSYLAYNDHTDEFALLSDYDSVNATVECNSVLVEVAFTVSFTGRDTLDVFKDEIRRLRKVESITIEEKTLW